ncbi:ferredoxin [Burkholderia cenocepacia]|uniref:PDR/VanB family oxidoreductase n=1 Tax=Burkholderia cenocepacia TaxID=95486 RepID=UPI00078DA081|nr:PDR/VanB family oxidoreductase [Burkholderia cenocepacia]AMU10864.1 ferredoxin [Burkholderia cenocepacia]
MQAPTLKVRVDVLRDEAHGVRSFSVSRIDGLQFDRYEPGAHVDVQSPSGVIRQYSLCGDPENLKSQLFAVKKEDASRGGSRSLHEEVRVGTELSIGAPRNLFTLDDRATKHILVGAGIGITPLISMAHRLVATDSLFDLHYFARSEEHAAFLDLLTRDPFAPHVKLHFGVEPENLVATLDLCLRDAIDEAHVYTCGPSPFMESVVAVSRTRIPEEAIHLERFKAEPPTPPGTTVDRFDIKIASSGRIVQVASNSSIIDALASIGIEVDTSCGQGVCGTCMVKVLDGQPDHRDFCLSQTERASNAVICCCVSRSRSPLLVLDL